MPTQVTPERHDKRRNIWPWRESRLRRLDWEVQHGKPSERQRLRAEQLANDIQIHWATSKKKGWK